MPEYNYDDMRPELKRPEDPVKRAMRRGKTTATAKAKAKATAKAKAKAKTRMADKMKERRSLNRRSSRSKP